jgi:hypothetical protein
VALPGTTARPCLQVRQAVAAMSVQRPQPACAHHTRCMPACQGMCRAPACTVCHAQVSFRSGASALYGLLSLQHRDNVDQAISKRRDVSSADVQRALCSSSARSKLASAVRCALLDDAINVPPVIHVLLHQLSLHRSSGIVLQLSVQERAFHATCAGCFGCAFGLLFRLDFRSLRWVG